MYFNDVIKLSVRKRDSNIELLRIVSMILVLVTHAAYVSTDPPSQSDISICLGSSFMRAIVESLSEVCVNSFVLISGWFGIRSNKNRLFEFLFQVFFISFFVYVIMRMSGLTKAMNIYEWIDVLMFKFGSYWFVRSYLILYLFAPVLNSFVEYYKKEQLRYFLLFFFLIQTIYGFYNSSGWFSSGYSPLSFMGLYMLARYMRLYPNIFVKFNKYVDIAIYIVLSLITAAISLSLTYYCGRGGTILFLYSSPLVIVSSIYFFLFFTKMSFQRLFVNWISVSCFAVYLVHCSPSIFQPYYICRIREWYTTESSFFFVVYTACLILFFFTISIFIDKIRIVIWKKMSGLIQ